MDCPAKVGNLQMTFEAQQQVLGLDIAVDYMLGMAILRMDGCCNRRVIKEVKETEQSQPKLLACTKNFETSVRHSHGHPPPARPPVGEHMLRQCARQSELCLAAPVQASGNKLWIKAM